MHNPRLFLAGVFTLALLTFGAFTLQAQQPQFPCPADAAFIPVGTNIQQFINARPAGTVFCLQAGIHRLQTIIPRNGDQFIGENGAILSGARLITSFQREGVYWVITGQTQQGAVNNQCAGVPRCGYPEDLYINNTPLFHEGSKAAVGAGEFFFDYAVDRVFFTDDPTGKTVEMGTTTYAFDGTATGVVIRNLIIEKYANNAQEGAIRARGANGWRVEGNTIRLNHSAGINLHHNLKLIGNVITRNGQIGIAGIGNDVLVENNEISYNNYARYAPGWEAGGTKFAYTNRLVVRGNYVHRNTGPGLWTDIDNRNSLYENNIVAYNTEMGIFHEISYAATIRNNWVGWNAFPNYTVGWLYGAQIFISTSRDVIVENNTVVVPDVNGANGITAVQQNRPPWQTRNVTVRNNTIYHLGNRGINGAAADFDSGGMFAGGLSWSGNDYFVPTGGTGNNRFEWSAVQRNFASWQGLGFDTTASGGSMTSGIPAGAGNVPTWNGTTAATLTPTPIPSPTATVAGTTAPTDTPFPTAAPTASPTPQPTLTPTATIEIPVQYATLNAAYATANAQQLNALATVAAQEARILQLEAEKREQEAYTLSLINAANAARRSMLEWLQLYGNNP